MQDRGVGDLRIMNITKTTTHKLRFTVEAFWNEDLGMGHQDFGQAVETIEQAVETLQLAEIHDPKLEWVIVARVSTYIKQS